MVWYNCFHWILLGLPRLKVRSLGRTICCALGRFSGLWHAANLLGSKDCPRSSYAPSSLTRSGNTLNRAWHDDVCHVSSLGLACFGLGLMAIGMAGIAYVLWFGTAKKGQKSPFALNAGQRCTSVTYSYLIRAQNRCSARRSLWAVPAAYGALPSSLRCHG